VETRCSARRAPRRRGNSKQGGWFGNGKGFGDGGKPVRGERFLGTVWAQGRPAFAFWGVFGRGWVDLIPEEESAAPLLNRQIVPGPKGVVVGFGVQGGNTFHTPVFFF